MATPAERYTPGVDPGAVAFMAARRAETHAAFLLPALRPGMALLDCGCGPGTITAGLAAAVAPGPVDAVDAAGDQFAQARVHAAAAGVRVAFHRASVYALPFPAARFDAVLAHALLEHLADPVAALREIRRVARPGAVVGVCSPDWGGFVLTPPTEAVQDALDRYQDLQRANGGDPLAGRRLGTWLEAAGLELRRTDARYERYAHASTIAGYLAAQLEAAGWGDDARHLRDWAEAPTAMFAQAWVSALAQA